MLFAEGPICCVGSLALLIVIFGLVMLITSLRARSEGPVEVFEPNEPAPPADYGQALDDYPTQIQNRRYTDY